jgi:hypothetical protein
MTQLSKYEGIPKRYEPQDLDTYYRLFDRCITNGNINELLILLNHYTILYVNTKKLDNNGEELDNNDNIQSNHQRVKSYLLQLFNELSDNTPEHRPLRHYIFSIYIDSKTFIEKYIQIKSRNFCSIFNDIDKNDKTLVKEDFYNFVIDRFRRSLNHNYEKTIQFATDCTKYVAEKGQEYKTLLNVVLDKIVDTQQIICDMVEEYLKDPNAQFYHSYAGAIPHIASVINPENKKKISKWEYLVSAIKNGQLRRIEFMMTEFEFSEIDKLFRNEIVKIKIGEDIWKPYYNNYSLVYELLYGPEYQKNLSLHRWDLCDVFLEDHVKYFRHPSRLIETYEFLSYYTEQKDIEIIKYVIRKGISISFSCIYGGFRQIMWDLQKLDGQDPYKQDLDKQNKVIWYITQYSTLLTSCIEGNANIYEDKYNHGKKIQFAPVKPFEKLCKIVLPYVQLSYNECISFDDIPQIHTKQNLDHIMQLHKKYFGWY